MLLFCKERNELYLFLKQVLKINDIDDFFGSDLLPWLNDEINKFIMSYEPSKISYKDIFMILVS